MYFDTFCLYWLFVLREKYLFLLNFNQPGSTAPMRGDTTHAITFHKNIIWPLTKSKQSHMSKKLSVKKWFADQYLTSTCWNRWYSFAFLVSLFKTRGHHGHFQSFYQHFATFFDTWLCCDIIRPFKSFKAKQFGKVKC